MYDRLHKEIDLVLIATPDHQHAVPSMMAIKLQNSLHTPSALCFLRFFRRCVSLGKQTFLWKRGELRMLTAQNSLELFDTSEEVEYEDDRSRIRTKEAGEHAAEWPLDVSLTSTIATISGNCW